MEWIMTFHWEYIMIPTDYHSCFCFRGVGIPPTRIMSYNPHEKMGLMLIIILPIYKWVWLKSIRDL